MISGGGFSCEQRRENIQRHMEESRTERKDRRAGMTRARESGERDGRDRERSRLREQSGEQEMDMDDGKSGDSRRGGVDRTKRGVSTGGSKGPGC